MRYGIILLIPIILPLHAMSGGEFFVAGGRSLAMGRVSVSITDFWSVYNNQAANAFVVNSGAGISIENRYLVKELSYKIVAATIVLKPGSIGIVATHFGTSVYSEIKAGIIFARKFGKFFAVGVQLDYLRFHIAEDYGTKNLFSFEVSFFYKATKGLSAGLQVINPVPLRLTDDPKEYLPTLIRLGISYAFSPSFITSVEMEKDLDHPPIIRAGAEYRFCKPLAARIGVAANPATFTFGVGLTMGRFDLDVSSGYQPILGFTPGLSLIYGFGKNGKR